MVFSGCSSSIEPPVDNSSEQNEQNDPNGSTNNGNEEIGAIAITSPEDGDYENNPLVTIEGTAEDADEVEINGDIAEVDDGHWEIDLVFEEGDATVTAVAGDAEDSVDFVVDFLNPQFTVDSPERGQVIDADADDDTIAVSGQVTDAGVSGLLFFEVNGQFVDVDDEGYFDDEVSLSTGLNTISFKAVDRAHNESTEHRAAIYGPLEDPNEPIESAAGADITAPSGTDAIADVIEAYLTPEQLEGFIEDGFDSQEAPIDLTTIDWSDLNVEIVPQDGYLELELTMSDLLIAGELDFGDEPTDGSLSVGEIAVTLDVALEVEEDNELEVEVLDDSIELEDITVNFAGEDVDWAEPLVAVVVVYAFNSFVPGLIEDNLYDPDMLVQEVEFLGRTLEITLILEDILITTNGIHAVLGIEFPGSKYPEVPDVAGALHRPVGDSLGGSVDRDVILHSTRTGLDRVMHGLWHSGLFHQQVGNDDLDGADIPFQLTASGIGVLLDSRIADIHESDTPVEFRFRPLLAPVMEFGSDDDVTARLGDFLLDLVLVPDEGGIKETLFLTVALQLDLDVEFEISNEGMDFDIGVDAEADVVAEPEFSFDQDRTTDLVIDLLELVPQIAASDLSVDADTALEWATISDPTVVIHGSDNTRISVGVDLNPAQEFIEDDDVDADD